MSIEDVAYEEWAAHKRKRASEIQARDQRIRELEAALRALLLASLSDGRDVRLPNGLTLIEVAQTEAEEALLAAGKESGK